MDDSQSPFTWDERFRRGEHVDAPPLPIIVRAAELLPPGRALDLACGGGRHACLLQAKGWDVVAVDSSSVALELIAKRCPAVTTVQCDLESGRFTIEPGCWDLIVDTLYLQRNLFPAIRAGLRPGGLFGGAFLTSGRFAIESGELEREFNGFEMLHLTAGEILARKNDQS